MSVSETYNMDCMDYMRTLPDRAFELAIVDPPYGSAGKKITRTGGSWSVKYQKNKNNIITVWDKAPSKDYFTQLFRVSKNQIIWGGNYFSLPACRCFLVWYKSNVPVEGFSLSPVEYAWTSLNGNASIFKFQSNGSINNARIHPTQKPVELYKWIIANYAHAGDRILDTHLGSGSSRIAAYDMGFDFVGIEIDKEYYEAEEKRYMEHISQLELIPTEEIHELMFEEK